MTKVEDAIAEIDHLLVVFAPPQRGLNEYARFALSNHALEEINKSIATYDRRMNLLRAAKAALSALLNDGHPLLPLHLINPDLFQELVNDASDLEAAKAIFGSNAAADITLTGGNIVSK